MTTIYESAVDHALRSMADNLDDLQQGLVTAHPADAARIWNGIQEHKLFRKLNQVESTALSLIPRSER